MSNYLALRSSATPSFTVSTLTGSTITAKVISLQSTTVSIGQSTNQAYTNFTSGSFSSTLMTSTLSAYNSLSTVTKVSMSQDGRYQYALQSVPSTANYYQLARSADTGVTWNTLNTSTMGLPQGSLAYQSTVSGFPTYSNFSQSATGQYALAATSGGQLYVSNNASSATPVYTPANVGGAPYAYLPMDSLPITDMMGNTTITVTGSAPLVAGKIGTSAINLVNAMNGANATNYISGTWTGSANYTVSFWFRIPAYSSTQQTIFSGYGGANIIFINPTTNTLAIYIPSGGGVSTTNYATTSFAISLNTWYNVVAIFQTGGLCSFYVNNTLINSTTNSGGLGTYTTTSFRFGTYDTALSNSFSGYIDDFRLYNFAAPNSIPPYIYLPLDGSLVDAMGNVSAANLTATGGPAYVQGVVGSQAISFANPAGGVPVQYISGSWTLTSTFSVSLWVNVQNVGTNSSYIFMLPSANVTIQTSNTSYGTALLFYIPNPSTNTSTSYAITLNTWYYVVAIYQTSGTCSFYVNNVLVGQVTSSGALSSNTTFSVGANSGNLTNYALNGYVDDIRLYNYAIPINPIIPLNWSHTAVSGTGQYMMAAAANGGVFYSSTYGASWSQLTASQISSLVGTGNAAKTLMGPIIQPNSTVATAATWSVNGVTWTASASSNLSGTYAAYGAFNAIYGVSTPYYSWASSGITGLYNTSSPFNYVGTGAVSTTIQSGIGAITGEYLQLQTSTPLVMYSYTYGCGGFGNLPKIYYIVGSNDGTTWYPIQYVSMTTTPITTGGNGTVCSTYIIVNQSGTQTIQGNQTGSGTFTTYATTTNAYTYFRILATNTYGGNIVEMGEWIINFATPMPLLTAPATAPNTSAVTVTPQMTNLTAPTATTTWSTPNGVTWTASATSTYTGNSPINYPGLAFNGVISGATTFSWASGTTNYVNGVAQTTNTNMSAVYSTSGTINIKGEALQLQASVPLVMNSYSYAGNAYIYAPKTYSIIGSNDGITWYNLHSASTPINPFGTTNTIPLTTYITVNFTGTQPVISSGGSTTTTTTATQYSTNAYTYFRIIADNVYSGTIFELAEFYANFTAYTPNPVNALAITNGGQNMLVAATGTTMPNSTAAAASWTANGVNWTTLASTFLGTGYNPYMIFDYTMGNTSTIPYSRWVPSSNTYRDFTPGNTSGITMTIQGIGSVQGDWVQLQSSVPLIMYSYQLATGFLATRLPKTYYIVGSNDGSTWFPIQSVVGGTVTSTAIHTLVPSVIIVNFAGTQIFGSSSITTTIYSTTTTAYVYFRLVCLSSYSTGVDYLDIGEWFINFQAGSTYLSTNYGSTWSTAATAPTNAPLLATSGNGLYTITGSGQLATVYSNAALTTYTIPTLTGITANINCASISSSGQNMIILTQGTTNNVFYSTNFGATFTGMTVGTLPMTSCAISADGNEIMVSNASNVYTLNRNTQGFSITMGNQSGLTNQGQNSIAIGNLAGVTNQSANSIILNASGAVQDAYNPGFFVSPVLPQATSTQTSVNLLGYGADNQVVQTGMSVRADGTFNPFNVNNAGTVGFAGNVGFGTTVPTAPLHLYASTTWPFLLNYSSGPQLVIGNNGTSNIALDTYNTVTGTRPALCLNPSGGSVGIGTMNPNSQLTIYSPNTGRLSCLTIQSGQAGIVLDSTSSGSNAHAWNIWSGLSSGDAQSLNFFDITRGTFAMCIQNSTGYVGIGVTNPSATLHVNGSLAKSSGTFDIEHPLYPNTQKRLVHSFIEGPRCDLIYRGKKTLVAGQAIIDINKECTFRPEDAMDHGTFEALCANSQMFLQNMSGFSRVTGSITAGTLTITCENSTSSDMISWMVVAERKDLFIKKWDRTDVDGYLITQYES